MGVTIENVEFYLLILIRISAFIFTAPIFSISSIPVKVKAALSVFLTMIVGPLITYEPLSYTTVYGFAGLVIKEFLVGLLVGYVASICTRIISFAGQLLDQDIGYSMANMFDPVNGQQVTVTSNLLSYFVLLVLLVTNMHYYLLRAIISTFTLIPMGQAKFSFDMYNILVRFLGDMFIIGFRIVLPIFASILIVNTVLAILAKVAPQMNMFVIGFQLKIIVGLLVLLVIVSTLPTIGNFIFEEMKEMLELIIKSLAGS
ncbi:MAG: flagellar biosynthetic protein FliR [bacterium]|nr:flagellar biosynthetic protein FliR [bacterium]